MRFASFSLPRRSVLWALVAMAAALAFGAFPATSSAQGGATVSVGSAGDLGDVLVGPDGRTLYTFDQDSGSVSSCYDACEDAWPPLTVTGSPTAGGGVPGTLGTTERDDGSMQVTYNGEPLYYYVGDGGPGEANGQGLNDVWWVIEVAASNGSNGDDSNGDDMDDDNGSTGAPATGNAGLAAEDVGASSSSWVLYGAITAAIVAAGGAGALAVARRRD